MPAKCFVRGGGCVFGLLLSAVVLSLPTGLVSDLLVDSAYAQDRDEQLRKVGLEFIKVGKTQLDRGLYIAAQTSLKRATEYRSYLTDSENSELNMLLAKAEQASEKRKAIADTMESAREQADKGNYATAIDKLQGIADSEYLSDSERENIQSDIKRYQGKLQSKRKELQKLYEKSVELYRQGEYEQAKAGFEELSLSGMVVGEPGRGASDYLRMIERDVARMERMERAESMESIPSNGELAVEDELPPLPEFEAVEDPVVDTGIAAMTPQPEQMGSDELSGGYIERVTRQRRIQQSYVKAFVDHAVQGADKAIAEGNYQQALSHLREAQDLVNKQRMALGDQLYRQYTEMLENRMSEISAQQQQYQQQQAQIARQEAAEVAEEIRQKQQVERQNRIENLLETAKSYQSQQRYQEALDQINLLLAIDPLNDQGRTLKLFLTDIINYRRQLEIFRESDREEFENMLETEKATIPYAQEMVYPKTWRDIVKKRESEEAGGISPIDAAVYRQLQETVDLSALTEDTPFSEAIDIVKNSIQPPLKIVVLWRDLSTNAYIEPSTPINMQGLSAIPLGKGLELLLNSVSGGLAEIDYAVEDGIVTIATKGALPGNMITKVYDISELLQGEADFALDLEGSGGGSSRSSGGGSSRRSGSSRGSSSGGDLLGTEQVASRIEEVVQLITETIEPDTWLETGGEGSVKVYSQKQLIIKQTPEVHQQIQQLIKDLRMTLGQQVSIEARFLIVSDNFLEDIGMNLDISYNDADSGQDWQIDQDHYWIVEPEDSGITGNLTKTGFDAASGFGNIILDQLQLSLMVRATQSHQDAKTLVAPKVTVLSGESASIRIERFRDYVEEVEVDLETLGSGEESIPYLSLEVTTATLPTGTVMNVTPTISADKKYVLLRITTWVDNLLQFQDYTVATVPTGGGGTFDQVLQLPETEISEVRTRVSVPDGGTVLLGGQKISAEINKESGVPILSKIPILGRAFRNDSMVRDQKVLLILVTPKIILQDEAEREAINALQ